MTPATSGRWMGQIAPSVASYWVCSIGLVFLNKHLLSGGIGARLNVPLFITWFQCCVTVIVCIMLSRMTKLFPVFPKLDLDPRKCLAVLPLSIVFVAMISFNNLCLRNNGVSFYYIGRSTSTIFNVFLSQMILGTNPSKFVMITCLIIIIGFSIGSNPDVKENPLSTAGVFYGILASVALALNAIYTKKILPKVDNCLWKLTWYNNIVALALFIPIMWVNGDISRILESPPVEMHFWQMLFISGLFGFTMNYVTGWQIEATSPLTHNISATAKSATQTLLAVIIYRELKPVSWWISNIVILFGSFCYTYARHLEMKREKMKELKNK